MYGLLLDSIQKFLREKYGEHYWIVIRRRAKLKNHWFMTHEVYSDTVMTDLIDAAASTLGEDRDYVMQLFGEYFVKNIGRYGYARLLRVLGRDMRDFLNGLDDLHEYLRFSYPKIKPPSFFCENETPGGMVMHYRTKRRGYLPYVIGQLRALGKVYKKDLEIVVLSDNMTIEEGSHFVLDLKFDNYELMRQKRPSACGPHLNISSNVFLSIFPFCILFGQDLEICIVGDKMGEVLPSLLGRRLNQVFELNRPRIVSFTWESVSFRGERERERRERGVIFDVQKHDLSQAEHKYFVNCCNNFIHAPLATYRMYGEFRELVACHLNGQQTVSACKIF